MLLTLVDTESGGADTLAAAVVALTRSTVECAEHWSNVSATPISTLF